MKQGGFEGVEKNEFRQEDASDEFMQVRTDVRARACMSNFSHVSVCFSSVKVKRSMTVTVVFFSCVYIFPCKLFFFCGFVKQKTKSSALDAW